MSTIPAGKPRELAPSGSHNAVCIQVIDLGTQPSRTEGWDDQRKCQLAFQLVDESTTDGKAIVVYKEYTYSSGSKSKLSKDIKAWLSLKDLNDFEMDTLLGKSCIVTVTHNESKSNGNTYANVTNISGLTKGAKVRKHTEPLISLYLDETFDQETFDNLPEFMRNKISGTPEYAEIFAAAKKTSAKKPKAKAKR